MGNILTTVEGIRSSQQRSELAKRQDQRAQQQLDWQREDRESNKAATEAQQQRNALLARLRGQAAQGDEAAQRELITVDPKAGKEFLDAFNALDERGQAQAKQNLETLGRSAAYIRNAQDPVAAYNTVRQNLAPEVAAKMPEEYNPDWVEFSLARTQELTDLLENPQLITFGGEDRLYRGGQQVEATTSNALLREQEQTKRKAIETAQQAAPDVKAADINAIYRQSAELLGGIFDQQGNLQTLDPNARANVQAITTEAARLLQSGEARNIAESVTLAARKQGVTINNLQGQGGNPEDLIEQYVN